MTSDIGASIGAGTQDAVRLDPPRKSLTLGESGIAVSRLAYGCWRFVGQDPKPIQAKIETALECGMTLIDTADVYGLDTGGGFGDAETVLGKVLAAQPGLREAMVLTTKGGIRPPVPYNCSREVLVDACEASLKRLQTDHVDLYLVHRPDLLAPFEEVAAALTGLRESGKIREAGVSNFTPSQVDALQVFLDFPLVAHQPEFSAYEQTAIFDGRLDQVQAKGMVCMAWSPLAGGALATGEAAGAMDAERLAAVLEVLERIAGDNGASRTAAALAWVLAHPANMVPIVGSQNEERIKDAAKALEVSMTRRDWYDVVEARQGKPMP